MDWQCLSVQTVTVYGYNITVIPPTSECQISACDIYVFSSYWEFDFPARGSNCLLQGLLWKWNRSCSNKNHCTDRLHLTSDGLKLLFQWNAMFQHMTQFGFMAVKWQCSDWHCQLSGSRTDSLNLHKLWGCFFYSLGTRLAYHIQAHTHILTKTDCALLLHIKQLERQPIDSIWCAQQTLKWAELCKWN